MAPLALLLAALIPSQLGALPMDLPPLPPGDLPVVAPPELEAASWILYDATHDAVLDSHRPDDPRAMASVTKLMTALVVRQNADLDELVTVSEEAAATGQAEVGLVPGEQWTAWELVSSIMVRSANDAATALAEHVGGSVEGFAELMNAEAARLGMVNSHFTNPHGLDEPGHFSTANDLLILGRAVLEDPLLARLARTSVIRFRASPDGTPRRAENTNELLGVFEGIRGLKTGYTGDAGRVLVSTARRWDRTLMAVVLGSEDHFGDTRRLLEYGFGTMGPADRYRIALAGEEGGGPPAALPLADWLRARLAIVTPLEDGDPHASREPTPLEREIRETLADMVPVLAGGRDE